MHALTKRGMSVAEMTQLLERRELDPDEVATEVERLERVGLLDDEALAENLVRTLSERKGLGRQGIAAELRRRKVDDSAISEALEALDDDDELTRAIEVATKRAGQLRSYDAETAKRRLGAFMQRRGYSGSILSQAMSAALMPSQSGPRFQ
jgi:regulatory protein